jgi:hypothetical protein
MSTAMTVRQPSALPTQSFGEMVAMGEQLVKTGFLPAHLRTGAQVAAVILTGRELGMEPMRAVRSLSLVKGKVVESADSQLARFKADGGRAQFKTLTDTEAVLWLRHPNGDEHTETFAMADAHKAGLSSNDTYRKFPKAMLRSRVITAGLKSVGWEGAIGNYDPEELKGTPLEVAEPAEYVKAETVEPAQLAAPTLPVEMTYEEAAAITVGKTKRRLGEMSLVELEKLSAWAEEKGNHRVAYAAELLIAEHDSDDQVELLGDSQPIEVAA